MSETPVAQPSVRRRRWSQTAFLAAILVIMACFFAFHLDRFVTLEYLQSQKEIARGIFHGSPWLALFVYFLLFVAFTVLALPGISVWMISAGLVFGVAIGTVVVALASAVGATISLLLSRYLFRDSIAKRWSSKMELVNREVEKDGLLFLFTLRLLPIMPYFVVNLLMGLTAIRPLPFFIVTFFGTSIIGFVYVNAGANLGDLRELSDIWSLGLIGSLVALAVLPFAARGLVAVIRGTLKPSP